MDLGQLVLDSDRELERESARFKIGHQDLDLLHKTTNLDDLHGCMIRWVLMGSLSRSVLPFINP